MATLSVLAAALEATRRGRYAPASRTGQPADLTDTTRYPFVTTAELQAMSASIAPALCGITCYDVMGASTQVVVVEESSPLTIPFIAAQETRVSTCFVWCAARRRYTGVLSVTEYVKVLLHCEANPHEVERVSNLTVRQWLDLKREQEVEQRRQREAAGGGEGAGGAAGVMGAPEALVSATADESLAVCIGRMIENRVRRLAIVADDTDDVRFETSILSVLTFDILIQHVANRLFSTDVFGSASSSAGNRRGAADGAGSPNGGANGSDASLPQSVQKIMGGAGSGSDPADDGDALLSHEALDAAVGSATGAYRTVFEIPFARLPRLGKAAQHKALHGSYPAPVVVSADAPIATALRALIDRSIHSIAVVDGAAGGSSQEGPDGCLDGTGLPIIDVVTRNDAIRMESGGVFNLQVSVREALATSYHNSNGSAGGSSGASRPPVAVFYETDTLREIIEHFATRRVPVLFLVDPQTDAILSQLSITEVFTFLSESASA